MILTKENTKKINIEEIINQYLVEGSIEKILFIVPTNRKARQLKKELFGFAKNHSAQKIKIETLSTISSKLLAVSETFYSISEAASIVFLKQASSKVKLNYYSLYHEGIPNGTLDGIRNLILELKLNGITPNELVGDTQIIEESEKLKAKDIANIYLEYQSICKNIFAYDNGDIYDELIKLDGKKFVENYNSLFDDVELIFVDGFSEFTFPEIAILDKLSNHVKTFLSFDYLEKNQQIFGHIKKCYERLEQVGFKEIEDQRVIELNDFRKNLREYLFASRKIFSSNYKERLFEIIGSDKENEIDLIAKQIKKIIIEEKVKPSNICVAFNLVQEYSTLVKDVFEKYSLPINLTDRISLDNSSPIISIINFLEIIENDYYYKSLYRALNSAFADDFDIDVTNLQKIASEFKIISGKENWLSIINQEIANIKNDDENEITSDSLQKAKKDFEKITSMLLPFEGRLTIDEFFSQLKKLIVDLRIPINVLKFGEEQEKNTRALTTFLETTEEVFTLIKKEEGDKKKYSIEFFLNQLRTTCNWARFNVKEKSNYGILITSLEEIRGLKFDYLFIGGLCEGILPTRYSPQIFRSSSYKQKAKEHQVYERFVFYRAISSFNKKLFASYHLMNNKREVVKSNFLTELQLCFSMTTIDNKDFDDTIYTLEDLQIVYGKNYADEKATNDFEKEIDSGILSNIKKAIEIDKIRTSSPFGKSIFTGSLLSSHVDDELKTTFQNLKSRQYSISQLENYGKCPFKYFIERILNIKVIEEPIEDIEPIEMGRILHAILFEFYVEMRKKKIQLINCSDNEFEIAKRTIIQIAEKKLEKSFFKSPITFHDREKIIGINGIFENSILYRFLLFERNNSESSYIPKYFEVGFGKLNDEKSDESLSTSEPLLIDGIKLRGKIDRIEVNDEEKKFNVVDYKLNGKKPTGPEFKAGVSLQLPLYIYATADLLEKKYGEKFSPNEMFIYSLKYKNEEFGKKAVDPKIYKNVDKVIDDTLSHIKNYVDAISNGEFTLSPHDKRKSIVCNNCSFNLACRIDEVKELNVMEEEAAE